MTPADLLEALRSHGVRVVVAGDALQLSARRQPPADLLARVRAERPALLRLLRGGNERDLDPAELRHRFEELSGVYEYEAGLQRPEAELRAWTDVALDFLEADPERSALPNREARALAARALAAAGIPDPLAAPLRLERPERPVRSSPPPRAA